MARESAGEFTEKVVILTRQLAAADATGEEVESWPTPLPLGTGEHWARWDSAGGGERRGALRQSTGTVRLTFRHKVPLTAVDKVLLKFDARVYAIAGVWHERAPDGQLRTVAQLVGPGDST